ncbi:MAG: DUF1302 family protein [Proteobacteria bacterium]|uniref:DUF1302 domain-containing protein n=1 Tax=Aquabacterium sp. TaxID=1872578 RepID=UPI0035C707D9|nr:DUF1302 family protein [Pseudomonadota bacterium]
MNLTRARTPRLSASALAVMASMLTPVWAASIDTGVPELKVRWDNTFKYGAAFRLKDPSQTVAASAEQPNVDAGDLAFNRGLINNRIDILSELDASYRNVGMRVSGAAWYDDVYRQSSNDYPAGGAPNTLSAAAGGPNNVFTPKTRRLMGQKTEFSDAFVYGSTELGDSKLSVRAGRHTQLYGETLFLGANGIAYAQAPVDLIKAFSQPTAQFKEIALPVNQVSSNLQINPKLSVGAYYQLEWRPIRLPATGSYFSPADFVGDGANLLLLPSGAAPRTADRKGSKGGQYGMQVRFKVGDVDYGLYAAQFDEKLPVPVVDLTTGTYALYYQRKVKTFGASLSTVLGETNVAAEISTRRDTPLAPLGDLVLTLNPTANNTGNTPYALGNTLHINVSAISVMAASSLWDAASVVGELAYNRLMQVTRAPSGMGLIPDALNTTHSKGHLAGRVVFQPEYFQVLPQLDLQVPIGIGMGLYGRSAVFQVAPERGGDMSIGFNFDYQKTWKAGLQFTHYFGSAGPAPSLPASGPTGTYASYKQYYKDRDFISLTIQRSF